MLYDLHIYIYIMSLGAKGLTEKNEKRQCHPSTRLHGVAQIRRDEILLLMEILLGSIPAPEITSPKCPKKQDGLILGNLRPVNEWSRIYCFCTH